MTERLIAKLDRLGAEAGIKEMTPEIYRFAQLLNDDKLKQWDEWRAKREWVGLTRRERFEIEKAMSKYYDYQHECKTVCLPEFAAAIEAKLKEKNT
jgi:hypothetical protein